MADDEPQTGGLVARTVDDDRRDRDEDKGERSRSRSPRPARGGFENEKNGSSGPPPTSGDGGDGYGGMGGGGAMRGHSCGGGGGGGDVRPGDWTCPSCGANVFASKTNCFKCHAPKPGGMGGAGY